MPLEECTVLLILTNQAVRYKFKLKLKRKQKQRDAADSGEIFIFFFVTRPWVKLLVPPV